MVCYYLFTTDSRESRSVLPWAFLIAGVASVLIGIWVIVYICFVYPKNEVYVIGFDDNQKGHPEFDDKQPHSSLDEPEKGGMVNLQTTLSTLK